MTATDQAWIDNSSGDLRQFDFWPPAQWTSQQRADEQIRMLAILDHVDAAPDTPLPGWAALARCLPEALRTVLILELRAGNQLRAIGSSGWPAQGSIVVNVSDRFGTAKSGLPQGVSWRAPNDPHYCLEELSQTVNAVEHLILA